MPERIFTRDVGKNFKKGERRDYPAHTWAQIAKNAKKPLNSFSKIATMVEEKEPVTAKEQAPPAT